MRILYGVAGEGMGHATRSRVVIEHLQRRGHQVRIVASGRACGYLARCCGDVLPIRGLSLRYVRGSVAYTRTAAQLVRSAAASLRHDLVRCRGVLERFDPQVCISDFDSLAHAFGRWTARPVISLDHQHVIDRCRHHAALRVGGHRVAHAVVRAKLPGCLHYLVTSFYAPPVRRRFAERTTLVGPILRPEVLAQQPTSGGHVLIYQTSDSDPHLVSCLEALREHRFVVYGRGTRRSRAGSHVEHRGFDEARFLHDLASARAVVCNGGHTTLSEALYYGKPVLSIPLRRHGEQQLNAAYLSELGLGQRAPRLEPGVLRAFLAGRGAHPGRRIPPGNEAALRTLDGLLRGLS